jgi:hypothetical protein
MNKLMLALFTVIVSFISALILSCYVEHGDDTQVCSGVEYDPDEFACIRGALVPLDDDGNSSSSGEQQIVLSSSSEEGGNWYSKDTSAIEFTINTAVELAEFAELVNGGISFEGRTVKLGKSIMLNDTTNWEDWARTAPANTWTPIGDFRGTFDGNDHVVSGVYINNLNDQQGLFGVNKGLIENLGVIAFYVKGKNYVGGLVGDNGRNAKIENSYSIGRVSGENSVGGLVGNNSESLISNCFHSGVVRGVGENVGGLVGRVYLPGSMISNSYSTGTVTGQSNVGGLVGELYGSVSNSYSTSTVTGEKYVGGLIGEITNTGSPVRNSYAAGVVVGNERVGGLVGGGGTITSSYYDSEVSGQGDTRGTGKSTAEMKREVTFITWDFELIWGLDSGINNGYPYLLGIDY